MDSALVIVAVATVFVYPLDSGFDCGHMDFFGDISPISVLKCHISSRSELLKLDKLRSVF